MPYLAFLIFFYSVNCANVGVPAEDEVPYRFNAPVETFTLSKKLKEISGIDDWSDDELIAVQDEHGIVYFISKTSGEINREMHFAQKGDFEDLAKVDNEIYVLESNGTLYRLADTKGDKSDPKKYKTELSSENDVEGLFFDSKENHILLACKEKPNISNAQRLKGQKAIYAFDIKDKELLTNPRFFFFEDSILEASHAKYGKRLGNPFKPAALAIHPLNGDFYIASSVGNLLAVFNKDFGIKEIIRLPKKYSRQPEGLCFDQKGNLYLANEADGDKALLLKFDYAPKN